MSPYDTVTIKHTSVEYYTKDDILYTYTAD